MIKTYKLIINIQYTFKLHTPFNRHIYAFRLILNNISYKIERPLF